MKNIRAAARFAAFSVSTLGFYLIWFAGAFFVPNKAFWRQIIFRSWARAFVKISGMRIEVAGRAPQPPFFLVSNHLSYVDIPALRAVAEGVFVAKGEIENWPFAGKMVGDLGMIFINRKNRRDIPRAGREIIKKLSEGEGVIIFPEGTSTKGEEVLPFNSSFLKFAAETDLPVSYAAISYRTPENELKPSETICWWDDRSLAEHMWRVFQVHEFTAIINFGDEPVQDPNRKELARKLREKVCEKFIPVI
ncbi:MAG TPA: lysophospholipid acyltransferase family protein [Pyrinomonadaceae bacterium]|jgi:1-acyl-sn-glycerol-3-phosphate acyltransferase